MSGTTVRVRLVSLAALSIGTLGLYACASEQRPQPPARVSAAPPRAAAPLSPASYVATVGAADLFIERASEIALSRSTSARVRAIAVTLAQDHRGLAAQLSLSGRRLNLLPSAALPSRLQLQLDQLRTTATFDATYLSDMRAQHRELLALQRSFASAGSSPTLRQTASAALPIEERHSQQLR